MLAYSKYSFVILNIYPYNTGHLMVAPVRHTAEIETLSPEEHADIGVMIAKSVEALKKTYSPHAFNIGMNIGRTAGAGLESHLHYHIVPRWNGDTNFMPVIAETKVVSEMLEETYGKLYEFFKSMKNE